MRPEPVTTPSPGYDLLVEAEVGGAVGDEPVELDEAALVEQQVEPLAGGELALLVLLRHAGGAAALLGERPGGGAAGRGALWGRAWREKI